MCLARKQRRIMYYKMTNHKYAQCYAFKDSEDIGKVI